MNGEKITVDVEDVRCNSLNFYNLSEDTINALSDSILKQGQLENAIVYRDERNDGRKYTLLGGESRWRAITYLVERGQHNGNFDVVVVDKPINQEEELKLVMEDNLTRIKSRETLKKEIEKYEMLYDLIPRGDRPNGQKRDWIGRKLGISGKTVDNIKNGRTTQRQENSSTSDVRTYTEKDIVIAMKRNIKALERTFNMIQNSDNERFGSIVESALNILKTSDF